MNAVIPTAGQGTRLYPHTHTKPKAMVRIAGKPIIGHILAGLVETRISDVVIVVGGPMQNQIIKYAESEFINEFEFTFVEQEVPDGLGHSIYQARKVVNDDGLFIALGDMLFQNTYETFLQKHDEARDNEGNIGVKSVDEPQHYGVVELNSSELISRLVEKPSKPLSDLAISGVYIVEDSKELFSALEQLIENNVRGKNDEYQLTDALQRMVDQGASFGTFEVENWYDCGRPATLLEANQAALDRGTQARGDIQFIDDSVVVEPVDVGDDVTLSGSVVGPYVTIDHSTNITDSIVRDSIVGRNSTLNAVNIIRSIIGDNSTVEGEANRLNIGDNSSIQL